MFLRLPGPAAARRTTATTPSAATAAVVIAAAAEATAAFVAATAVTATAVAATAAATAAEAATAATSASRAILGRIHAQGAAAELIAVELLDRLRRVLVVRELHERKSARTSRLAIGGQKYVTNLAYLSEEALNFLFLGVVIQVSNKNF
jgi:hypothetical protein